MTQPELTVGMAVHSDFNGLYFSTTALRLYHSEVMKHVEIVVVDNNPDSPEGREVKNFLGWVKGDVACVKYIAAPEVIGTAAPRDRVFREASGKAVLCMDSHVLLWPGAVKRLIDWYADNPDSRDLLSGPMIMDDLTGISTHFNDEWRAEMWGTWGHDQRGSLIDNSPFEIPGMGLGLFTCRKEAWLGFNPAFRAFGGEEMYIHTKYRQAGAACLCLPFLRWIHRFGRPGGVPYPLTVWHKARNYVIGHTELGLPLGRVYEHFVKGGRVSEQQWAQLMENTSNPPETPRETTDKPQAQDQPRQCGGCGNSINQAIPIPTDFKTALPEIYKRTAATPSEINEHAETLRKAAGQCESVTEFVMQPGPSTICLLYGEPKKLTSYATKHYRSTQLLTRLMGNTSFSFKVGESLAETIEPCDMLLISTKHTADQLYGELKRHHEKVNKWIYIHFTDKFGEEGEGGGPGLLPALRRFLKEHPEWTTKDHFQHNNGLTCITKDPTEKPELPSGPKMAWNYAKAIARHVMAGSEVVSKEQLEARLDVCATCPLRNDDRCSQCGCFLAESPDGKQGKAWWPTEVCPVGKWTSVDLKYEQMEASVS